MHQVQEQEKREMQGVELEEQFGELNFNVNPEYY
jgi:hypothetical protein